MVTRAVSYGMIIGLPVKYKLKRWRKKRNWKTKIQVKYAIKKLLKRGKDEVKKYLKKKNTKEIKINTQEKHIFDAFEEKKLNR